MNKENKLTPDQEKELIMLATEIEAEAIAMKLDYDENPSHESGSVVYINDKIYLHNLFNNFIYIYNCYF
mgnify:CR=1 FL=1